MSNLALSIKEDYCHDDDEIKPLEEAEAEQFFDELESEEANFEFLEQELEMLQRSTYAIEYFGINPTSFQILKTTGLMSGTALESMTVSEIGNENYESPLTLMALEELEGKIEEKSAGWAAKILSFLYKGAGAVLGALGSVFKKMIAFDKMLLSKTWDAAKYTGKTIKAHPVKTILAVLAAAAAVAGIVSYVSTGCPLPGGSQEAMTAFTTRLRSMISAIRWPFGKVAAVGGDGTKALTTTIEATSGTSVAVVQEGTAKSLGFTAANVKAAGESASKTYGGITEALKAFWNRIYAPFKAIKTYGKGIQKDAAVATLRRTGSRKLAKGVAIVTGMVYSKFVWSIGSTIYKLIKGIVVGAFKIVKGVFGILTGVV